MSSLPRRISRDDGLSSPVLVSFDDTSQETGQMVLFCRRERLDRHSVR